MMEKKNCPKSKDCEKENLFIKKFIFFLYLYIMIINRKKENPNILELSQRLLFSVTFPPLLLLVKSSGGPAPSKLSSKEGAKGG